ncbi:MAG: aspartate carbamoyltransferase [Clostridia bacterium]|nr:aspartate carbamoyltransferase [Clostridia bacterium]
MDKLLDCKEFTKESLLELYDLASKIKSHPENYTEELRDKVIAVMFFEPSTRTRMSFEAAIQRLGAKMIVTENGRTSSSTTKGETLEDTIRVLDKYADAIIMRHSRDDAAIAADKVSRVPIINAGSGKAEHPTQALLDVFTILSKRGKVDGTKLAILGDLRYGRTTHSLIQLISLFENIEIYGLSKETFALPEEYIDFMREKGIPYKVCKSFDDLPKDIDVLYHTRIQQERFEGDFGKEEYIINKETLNKFTEKAIVLHPLPRNNEISEDIDNDPRAVYFEQAENGMYVRMAILKTILGD